MTVTEYLLKHAAQRLAEIGETLRVIQDDCCGYGPTEQLDAKVVLGEARQNLDAAVRGVTAARRLLTPNDLDTWERNPFYRGPAVPHPDDYEEEELTIDEINELLDDAHREDRRNQGDFE